MSGTRNKYTSAPLYGMKHKKTFQTADFSPREADTDSQDMAPDTDQDQYQAQEQFRYSAEPSAPRRRNASWLILLIALGLPLLFILSFVLNNNTLRIVFLVLAFLAILVMLLGRPFGRRARTSLSLVYTALMVVVAVALIVSLPTTPQTRVATPTNSVVRQATAVPVSEPTSIPEAAASEGGDTLPNDAGASAAQLQLMAFMNYWGENQLEQMVALCKPDWVANQENPKSALFFLLTNRTPLSYEVDGISGNSADDSRTITITALISKASNTSPEYYRMQVLMIRINNNWYVDPNSLNGSKVTVSASQDGTAITNTTVPTTVPDPTQVPTANTVLYYNPNGGKYYHATSDCASVDKKYLPLTALYYSDLNSTAFKSLLPCPKCKPPERPSVTGE